MFLDLNRGIREEVVALLFHAEVEPTEAPELQPAGANGSGNGSLSYEHTSLAGADAMAAAGAGTATAGGMVTSGGGVSTPRPVVKSELETIGRNDPCWCGSDKKYKKCHGA